MIIKSLDLKNFRQFFGYQKIRFSTDNEKNVTVIHGMNGSGKTTILNAFGWALYGNVNFDRPNRLLNERALAEAEINDILTLEVELNFEHNGRDYTVKRSKKYKRVSANELNEIGDDLLYVDFINEEGKTIEPQNPQNTIDQILPERMKEYFFFDGEKIANLSGEDSHKEIDQAIRNIMGLEILERSTKHLYQVLRELRKNQKSTASSEVKGLIENEEEIEDEKNNLINKKEELENNKNSIKNEIDSINDKLRNLQGSKELQEEYERYETEAYNKREELKNKRIEIKNICISNGHLAFILPSIKHANAYLEDKRKKGELPSGIKEQFIDDLLSKGKCICGTSLKPGNQHYEKIKDWRKNASFSKELDDAYIKTTGQLKTLNSERKHFFEKLRKLMKEKATISEELEKLEEKVDEIDGKLSKKDSEDIVELTNKRKEKNAEKEKIIKEIGKASNQIEIQENELKEIRNKISKAKEEGEKEKIAQRRAESCLTAINIISSIYKEFTEKTRKDVQEEVGKIYSQIIRKPYWAEISEDYRLRILKNVGGNRTPVAMSTGERQVASLSFIGGLVNIARKQVLSKKSDLFFEGGIYPIVMDSPFGILDPEYREKVSSGIPKLTNQIIVLVSETQWKGEVENKMQMRIGKEYNLIYHNPELDPDEKFEYTDIEEMV